MLTKLLHTQSCGEVTPMEVDISTDEALNDSSDNDVLVPIPKLNYTDRKGKHPRENQIYEVPAKMRKIQLPRYHHQA